MSVIDKLKSTEAIIGGVVALVAVTAKYAAVSGLLDLPDGVAGIAPHLSTLAVIVFTLLAIFLSEAILKVRHLAIGITLAAMLLAGIFLAVRFAENVREQSVVVECVNYPPTFILEPAAPSERLAQLIDAGGGIENAWCEEDSGIVRRLVSRENAGQVTALTFYLIGAEALLVLALTLTGWLVANKPGSSPPPTPAAPTGGG